VVNEERMRPGRWYSWWFVFPSVLWHWWWQEGCLAHTKKSVLLIH